MYDRKRFEIVTVEMDKKDYALENLIEDLPWKLRITARDMGETILCKCLMTKKDINWLDELTAISPYGTGYSIKIGGMNIYDPMICKWRRESV